MRNQPHSHWQVIDSTADQRDEAWNLDRQVGLRSWIIGCLTLIAVTLISVRLTELKREHQQDFLANANPTTVRSETVPAMDGRIYSSDGQLLAYDHQRFAVAVHYRWLEQPPNKTWWKQQARARLNRKQWSDSVAMDAARQAVLEEQSQLWTRLAAVTGVPVSELEARRQRIQKRVERIAQTVQQRAAERAEQSQAAADSEAPEAATPDGWRKWWELLKSELTESPRRSRRDPIIIQEELDYHDLIEDVPTAVVAEIESRSKQYPGTQIVNKTRRVYPLGDFAAHVIGNRAQIRAEVIEQRQTQRSGNDPLSYQPGDRQGRFGVEKSYDVTLRGLPGSRDVTTDRQGEVIASKPLRRSRSGNHLVLSLNSQLQLMSEQLLDDRISPQPSFVPPLPSGSPVKTPEPPTGGAVLVMNVYSGELIAAASAPRPDLTLLTSGDADYWKQLTVDTRAPLLSRITQVAIAPGSTFKPLTAVALCETLGVPAEPIECQGFLKTPESHRCAIFQTTGRGHAQIDLVGALASSCNVYFFKAAQQLGPEPLVNWTHRFGMGQSTGVDLPFERSGHVPSPADNTEQGRYEWYPGDNLGLSIGQSYLSVTPLQMLRMTAAIANGGELVTPTVVSRILPGEQTASSTPELPQRQSHLVPLMADTLSTVRAGMEAAVNDPKGTAFAHARSSRVRIAGKTGTAQTGLNRPNHAWFVGYAPAKNPRYAFVVWLEHGGAGGSQASPLVRQLAETMLDLGLMSAD